MPLDRQAVRPARGHGQGLLKTRNLVVCLLAAAGVLYALLLPRFHVGYFNDDAEFVLLARSLLQGRYDSLWEPGQPPQTALLPGFPCLLVPFVWIVAPHWEWLKLVALVLTLLSGVLLWKLLEGWLKDSARIVVLGLFLFNPVVAGLSSAVMADVCLMFSALWIMRVLRQAGGGTGWPLWAFGLLLGWAALLRPIAILLLPAAGWVLVGSRGWRGALSALLPAGALWGAFLWHNHHAAHEMSRYARFWSEGLPLLASGPSMLLFQWHYTAYLFFGPALTGLRLSREGWGFWASWALIAGAACLLARGFLSLWRAPDRRPLLSAMAIFVAGCFFVQALWPIQDTRYFLPLVAFSLVFLMEGICSWRFLFAPVVFLLVCAYGLQDGRLLAQAWSSQRPISQALPRETFEWIQRHVPENGLILGKSPTIYLYTHRQGLPAVLADDTEEYRYQCLRQGITHVISLPVKLLTIAGARTVDQDRLWRQNMGWSASWPEAFEPVYANASEGSAVFRVVDDRNFTSSYALYLAGREELTLGQLAPGLKALDQALRLRPGLVSALNAQGAALMLSGRLVEAEKPLHRALAIRPDHALALANLARLRLRQGRPDEARLLYARAKSSWKRTGEFRKLGPVLDAEAAALH